MSIIHCSTFIIPNAANSVNDTCWFTGAIEEMSNLVDRLQLPQDWKPQDGDYMIELWTHSDFCENWQCHGEFGIEFDTDDMFIRYLPARILESIKEGDSISFTCMGKECVMKFEQKPYRYRFCGNFEDALKRVMPK